MLFISFILSCFYSLSYKQHIGVLWSTLIMFTFSSYTLTLVRCNLSSWKVVITSKPSGKSIISFLLKDSNKNWSLKNSIDHFYPLFLSTVLSLSLGTSKFGQLLQQVANPFLNSSFKSRSKISAPGQRSWSNTAAHIASTNGQSILVTSVKYSNVL